MKAIYKQMEELGVDLMTTKEEYEKALKEMNDAFYGITFLNSQTRRFDDNLNLLRELVNEHFEERQEKNIEHYCEYLSKVGLGGFALVNGRCTKCSDTCCSECDFSGDCTGNCDKKKLKWLASSYRKPTYKLNQFEHDLLNTFDRCKECCLLNEIECLKKLREKGYFKGIDPFTKVHDIIDNCEVVG